MWTATDVSNDMLNIGKLLESRRKTMTTTSDASDNDQEKNMVQGCAHRIKLIANITVVEGKLLYDTIQQCSLSDDYKKILRDALDGKMSVATTDNQSDVVLKPQTLTSIQNYLSRRDWQILDDPKASYLSKVNVVVKRLRTVGVKGLHEQTAKYGVALVLTTLTQLPDHTIIHQMLQEFKQTFHRDLTKVQVPFIRVYPTSASELPETVITSAYSDEDPVEPREIENLCMIAENHIPLRATSKLLKAGKPQKELAVVTSSASQTKKPNLPVEKTVQEDKTGNFGNPWMMMQMMMQFMQKQCGESNGQETKVTLSPQKEKELAAEKSKEALQAAAAAFQPRKRQLALAEGENTAEVKESEPPMEKPAEEEEQQEERTKTPKDFEDATYEALLNKKGQAKQSAKDKGKEAMPKKSPKAKAKSKAKAKPAVMKRPSAQQQHYELPPWKKEDSETSRNTFTSRHWHAARSFAVRVLGYDDEYAKQYAKGFHEAAGELFDQHQPPVSKKKQKRASGVC